MNHRARLSFRLACYVCFVFAVLHLIGQLSGPPPPTTDDEATLQRLLSTVPLALPGAQRTMGDIVEGLGFALSGLFATIGALGLTALAGVGQDAGAFRRMTATLTAGMAILLGISLRYWFIVPTTLIVLALIGFGVAWILARRS